MNNIKLILAYDGSRYLGWQKNRDGDSIEQFLENVLSQILQHTITLQAASRTDAGVHALAQVVNFFTPKNIDLPKVLTSLNQLLPKDIRVNSIEVVNQDFHPTLDAKGKIYRYKLCTKPFLSPFLRHTTWHYPKNLSREKMQLASHILIGKKDFSGFSNFRKPAHKSTICEVKHIEIIQNGEDFDFVITGDHFLYKMVRNLVGSLVYVGLGKLKTSDIELVLSTKRREFAGVTAPSDGLFLEKVLYSKEDL